MAAGDPEGPASRDPAVTQPWFSQERHGRVTAGGEGPAQRAMFMMVLATDWGRRRARVTVYLLPGAAELRAEGAARRTSWSTMLDPSKPLFESGMVKS